jgi:hypothetical protein
MGQLFVEKIFTKVLAGLTERENFDKWLVFTLP